MNTFLHLWQYLADFSLEWETFRIKVVETVKTHIWYSVNFSQKSYRLWDNIQKYDRAWEDAYNMAPARGVLDKYGQVLS